MDTKFIDYFKKEYKGKDKGKYYEALALKLYYRKDRTGVILEFLTDLSEEDAKEIKELNSLWRVFNSYVNENAEFIWDDDALAFLAKYDKSLELSTALVHGTKINSVTLATALKQEMAKEDFDAEAVYNLLRFWHFGE